MEELKVEDSSSVEEKLESLSPYTLFCAPEVMHKTQLDERADLWAIGFALYCRIEDPEVVQENLG